MSRAGLLLDTSALLALVRLGLLELVSAVLGPVAITTDVLAEAEVPGKPAWLQVRASLDAGHIGLVETADLPVLPGLGRGESATIQAAARLGLIAVLDDADARRVAMRRGVALTGTVALLVRPVRLGEAGPIEDLLDRLDAMGFRIAPVVREWAVQAVRISPDADAPRPGT